MWQWTYFWIGWGDHNQSANTGTNVHMQFVWTSFSLVLSRFQFHNAKFEDIKFIVYTVNNNAAEVETIEVLLKHFEQTNDWNFLKICIHAFRLPMVIWTISRHHSIGFYQIVTFKDFGNLCITKKISKKMYESINIRPFE